MSPSSAIPIPDDKTYIRAVRGVLSDEHAQEHLRVLPSQQGWFALGLEMNPVTLAIIAVSKPFAEWYAQRYPAFASAVAEIRSMPEEAAFEEIRKGRWVRFGVS